MIGLHKKPRKTCCLWHKCKNYYKNHWVVVWLSRPLIGLTDQDDEFFSPLIGKLVRLGEDYATLETTNGDKLDIRFDLLEGVAKHRFPDTLEEKLKSCKLKTKMKIVQGGKE